MPVYLVTDVDEVGNCWCVVSISKEFSDVHLCRR